MDSNTKSGEPNIPTSQENITQLCKGQCGFFGTADNQGFCSVCFKKEVAKKEKSDEKKEEAKSRLSTPESTSGSVTDAMAGLMKPILSNPTPTQPPTSPTTETPETIDSKPSESVETKTPDEEESSQPPAKKQKKKCGVCKKKLGLTGFECRCGKYYCGIHRYSDQHNCPFDYKSDGRKLIAAQNPTVRGEKIAKL